MLTRLKLLQRRRTPLTCHYPASQGAEPQPACGSGGGGVMDSVTMGVLTRWERGTASITECVCVCLFTSHQSGFNKAWTQRGDVSGAEHVCVSVCVTYVSLCC